MDDERFLELARDLNHIRGIYNYCDRWCERCDHQSQCLAFAVEHEERAPADDHLEGMHDSLTLARKLLDKKMEESGLDPEEADRRGEEMIRTFGELRSQPLVQRAEQYAFGTAAHLQTLEEALVSAAGSLQQKIELGISPNQGLTLQDLERCRDALETIVHFRFLICSKIFRALSGMALQADGRADPYSAEDGRRSAQVAWRGIHRSIDAWLTLRDVFLQREAGILEMLLQLDRLRREVEALFPGSTDPAEEELGHERARD